jgi:heme exporter protein A
MRSANEPLSDASDARICVCAEGVSQVFGRRRIFQDVSFQVTGGQVCVITGSNGSGKSTLLKIIAGLQVPSSGTLRITIDGASLDTVARRPYIGYAAPDLSLYRELSGRENLRFFAEMSGVSLTRQEITERLDAVGLKRRGSDAVAIYSSGMKQRLKLAFALLLAPPILLLDEPTANLDADGWTVVENIVAEQSRQGGIVLIASNEPREVQWAQLQIHLEPAG